MSPKHVPLRTCVGCWQVRPKRELVRIVRTPEGAIEVDQRGKRSGRGAYLCRNRSCWGRGLEKGGIEHALKTHLTEEQRAMLLTYAESLPADNVAQSDPG